MATNIKTLIQSAKAASKDVRQRFADQLASRKKAKTILNPEEVAGRYDRTRDLQTTLGGKLRAITEDDLAAFKATAEELGKKYRGGITPKQIIDLSTHDRRVKAQNQIRMAVPVQYLGALVHFMTNAGPGSLKKTHHVQVEFLNMVAAYSSPSPAKELVKMVTTGRVKFDCDCEDHRYRYRYIAAIGKWNAGRAEPGFPKITNPNMTGVACKHALRVMQVLTMPVVRNYVVKMIDAGRKNLTPKLVATTKKEQAEIAALQQKELGRLRNRVESSAEKVDRLASQRESRGEKNLRTAQVKAVRSVVEKTRKANIKGNQTPAQRERLRKQAEAQARSLFSSGFITKRAFDAIIKKSQGN